MSVCIDRRRYERFAVEPSLTGVAVRVGDEPEFVHLGHAYDVSEGGVCFELDNPIQPGTPVSMRIDLPAASLAVAGDEPGQSVYVSGTVVWCRMDEPGPAKLAMVVSRFDRAADRGRLVRAMTWGRHLRAA